MFISSNDPALSYSGRWTRSSNSATASWCSSTISFNVHGSGKLCLLSGSQSERKDRFGGGTPTLVWTVDDQVFSCDVEGENKISLLDRSESRESRVEVVLADWASVIEVLGFETQGVGHTV